MRTRDGREVRIFCRDGGGKWPVMGAYLKDGVWIAARWSEAGRGGNQSLDLPAGAGAASPRWSPEDSYQAVRLVADRQERRADCQAAWAISKRRNGAFAPTWLFEGRRMIPLAYIGPSLFAYTGLVLYVSLCADVLYACRTLFLPLEAS